MRPPTRTTEVNEAIDAAPDLEELYRQHGQKLWRAVYAYAGNASVADDSVSEAFAQALRRGDALRDALSWIWRVAFLVAAGELAEGRATFPAFPTSSSDPDLPLDLIRALQRLSPRQRAAILLHHYAGYSTAEIAQMVGSTAGAIRVHLSVGRRRLRRHLELQEHDDA